MASAEDFVHLYVDEPKWLRIFLMFVIREGGKAVPAVADTLLELLLREWARAPGDGDEIAGGSHEGEAGVRGGVVGERGSGRQGKSIGAAAARKQRESEIMNLLHNPRAGYDADHALALVQMLDFKPGQLYLYEKVSSAAHGLLAGQRLPRVVRAWIGRGVLACEGLVGPCRRR